MPESLVNGPDIRGPRTAKEGRDGYPAQTAVDQ
jgi:hypothetical protein